MLFALLQPARMDWSCTRVLTIISFEFGISYVRRVSRLGRGILRLRLHSPSLREFLFRVQLMERSNVGAGWVENASERWRTGPVGFTQSLPIRMVRCLHQVSGSPDHIIRMYDNPSSGRCIGTLKSYSDYAYCLSFNEDGPLLVSASNDNTIKIWEVRFGRCLQTLEVHSNIVNSVVFSPDGSRLVSGSDDKTFCAWIGS